jgi:hypothetical protein
MKLFNLIHPFFFRKKQANESKKNIASPDLIVLLSRYGDNAISLRVLREIFGSHISNVRIVTSRQFAPYITEIFPDASIYQLNPNHGLFGILQLLSSLSLQPPERAYNPWSYGDIPRKLISYAIRSENYANLSFPTELNWYSRVYQYFKKPTPVALSPDNNYNLLKTAKRIHIAPFSTDNKRSLPADSIRSLIESVQILNPLVDIEISGLPPQLAGLQSQFLSHSVSIHTLHKTAAASEHFINALRSCDLLITVDTGPLHIADLLDVPSIAFFGPSNPDSVLHPVTKSMPIRANIMRGSICMADCDNPLCLRAALDLFLKNDFDATIRATPIHTIVDKPCHYLDQASVKLP